MSQRERERERNEKGKREGEKEVRGDGPRELGIHLMEMDGKWGAQQQHNVN